MPRIEHVIMGFNRGRVSELGLGRVDVKRIAMSAETQTNWIPRVLGSMSLRPGMQYLGATKSNNQCRMVPFVFATNDTAILEMTDSYLRIWKDDELVARDGCSSTIDALTAWTDNDEAGTTSTWTGTYLQFVGTGVNYAIRDTSAACTLNVEVALRIVVARGPVKLRIGTSAGDDSYVAETTLRTGTHSIAFTPTATPFYIRLMSNDIPKRWVQSVSVEASGIMTLPLPYAEADLPNIRTDQSGDIVYIACNDFQQMMIERRDNNSWSIVEYAPNDGPFKVVNATATTITPSATTGNITLTASKALFKSTQIGQLFQITSSGQSAAATIAAQNTFTNKIVVSGVGSDRTFSIVLTTSSWAAGSTVTLQRSVGDTGVYGDVPGKTWTAVTVETYSDGLDNQIVAYRIGIKTGAYTAPDSITCTLSISIGSASGVVRVTEYTSSTSVDAEVLSELGGTTATDLWKEGEWCDKNGWPSAVALHEGRLWWAGKSKIWGSISDSYDSFDPDVTGDSGTINRSIGSGPVDTACWMSSNIRLLLGTQGIEYSIRSSTLDQPITPTSFVIKPTDSQGAAMVEPVRIDTRVCYVQRNGSKVYDLTFDPKVYDYSPNDLTAIIPEIGYPSISRIAVSRQPDTRVHSVRSDGTVAMMVQDANENMLAWVDVETDGAIEDVCVLPAPNGKLDDYVYYVVNRTINGSTVRYIEKWAQQNECIGSQLNYQADAFVTVVPVGTTISGLDHLEGEEVAVWADGKDIGTNDDYSLKYTVSGGAITVDSSYSIAVVGLFYDATFKSMKIGSPTQSASQLLNHHKNVNHIGLILSNTHPKGIRYGADESVMDGLPEMDQGALADPDEIYAAYDDATIEFPGKWDTDSRLYLKAQSPRPCTVLAVDLDLEQN